MITRIDGVDFDNVWSEKVDSMLGGVPVYFISREHMIQNKSATGRLQDRADVERLLKFNTDQLEK